MTYVYETLHTNEIAHRLCRDDNAGWHENYEACLALAGYIEQLAEDLDEPIELDIVAMRCDYNLFENIADYNEQYGADHESADEIDYTVIMVDDDQFICEAH